MAGLKIYSSNRLEELAGRLAEILSSPLASPLARETILVQSKGMERWLSMELASRHGICANYWFPFPNHFLYAVFREVLPGLEETSVFTPEIMTWRVLKALRSCLDQKGFESLRNYLSEGAAELKGFQLAERIADLFDQYLLFRPELILGWDRGKERHWQAALWREVVKGNEQKHRASLQKLLLDRLKEPGIRLPTVPERLSVFGISALPPFHLEILAEISRLIEVNLFLMNPCREYWGDLLTRRETRRVKIKAPPKTGAMDLHLGGGNSLLASMGALGRDFFDLISDFNAEEHKYFIDPGEGTLLSTIQADILHLHERSSGKCGKKSLSEKDDSLRVHSCHSPMREVEILQDRLLSLFESDPSLLPKDILVMTPDIAIYSPLIQAVFSVPSDDPRWIPFGIADRAVGQESQLADAFLSLLDFPGSRFGVTRVMALLECRQLQKRFSLSEEDLNILQGWIKDTRIRWGVDRESREKLGLPPIAENTWRAGLERMLLGYALPGQGEKVFKGILPYDRIEGSDAAVLGNFVAFAEHLFALEKRFEVPRTLGEWGHFLAGVLEEFFLSEEGAEREVLVIRRALHGMGEKEELSAFKETIALPVVKSYLRACLGKENFGQGFLAGGLTFCTMLPMRSIPFRVICLLGMNGDSYPRQTKSLGFDLMAQKPRRGDRSRRNDDRYLFLESILSAREKLHLSYVGRDVQDNSARPPSVLVSELLDYIRQGFQSTGEDVLEQIVTQHRIQAFSPEYFKNNRRLYSYSRENFEAAKRGRGPKEMRPFIGRGLPEPPGEWKTIDVNHLCRFFFNPAKFLLNERLEIYLEEEGSVFEESEPFELRGLQKYGLEQEMVEKGFRQGALKDFLPVIKASGQLPHGVPGECLYLETCRDVESFVESVSSYRHGPQLVPLEVDARLGDFHLAGRVENIYQERLLHFRYAEVKPKDRLRVWIHHLILNLIHKQAYPCKGILICKDFLGQYPPVRESETLLRNLLEIYWQGLTKPIPFFPLTSWTYVEALGKGKDRGEVLRMAEAQWEGNDFSRGEGADPYYRICFRHGKSLDHEFEELAKMILGPLWECEEKAGNG